MSPRMGLHKSKVLQQAMQMANQQGLQQVTIASLAKALGVRSPSLYNHFSGLAGLRKELALFGLQNLSDTLMRSVVGKAGDQAVRTLCGAYLTFVRENPGLYEAILSFPARADSEIIQAGDQVIEVIAQVLHAYHLSQARMIHAIRAIRSMLHGFAALEQAEGFQMDVDKDESFDFLITLFINGLHDQNTLN